MKRFASHLRRIALGCLIVCLIAVNAVAGLPPKVERVFDPLAASTVTGGTTTVDHDLENAGFTKQMQQHVLDWDALSPVRKIETAYYSAERAAAGSGEDFLAALAKDLAARHATLRTHRDLIELLKRPSTQVTFASLHRILDAPPEDPNVRKAIVALASHTEQSNLVRGEDLLRAGGLSEEAIYKVLRENTTRADALRAAVTEKGTASEQMAMLRKMAKHVVDTGAANLAPEIRDIAGAGPPPHSPAPPPTPPRDPWDVPPGGGKLPPAPPIGLSRDGEIVTSPEPQRLVQPTVEIGGGGLETALGTAAFLEAVGGVAFGQIAAPAAGTSITSFELHYVKTKRDGERVIATINGKDYLVEVPDWIVLPAVEWSATKETVLVTWFGHLVDAAAEKKCRLVFNYAPALQGTLIGLRLMQADMLDVDLARVDGRYVLGAGEIAPAEETVTARASRRQTALFGLPDYESYVLTDADRPIEFALDGDRVAFTGEPVYRVWQNGATNDHSDDDFLIDVSDQDLIVRAEAAEKALIAAIATKPLTLRDGTRIDRARVKKLADTVRSKRRLATIASKR